MRMWDRGYGRTIYGGVDGSKSRLGKADDSDKRIPMSESPNRGEETKAGNTLNGPGSGPGNRGRGST